MVFIYLGRKPIRCGTQFHAEQLTIFVLSSHADPIGDQNDVQHLSKYGVCISGNVRILGILVYHNISEPIYPTHEKRVILQNCVLRLQCRMPYLPISAVVPCTVSSIDNCLEAKVPMVVHQVPRIHVWIIIAGIAHSLPACVSASRPRDAERKPANV